MKIITVEFIWELLTIPSKEKNETEIHRISFNRFHILIANIFQENSDNLQKGISKNE